MKLNEAFQAVGLKLQEAATDLSQRDICSRLNDALSDIGRDNGTYYYIVDIFGDDESGDVVYSCSGDLMKAPYEFSVVNGKQVAAIDVDNAVDVMPRTTYEEEADEEDHYASMESALKRQKLYTELPLYERFISKDERDAADSSDFAGKGKSFPILKPGDVMAAVHSMGRAGDANHATSTLKANIIRIAKRKGWTKYLPKAWQNGGSDSKESKAEGASGSLKLTESAATIEPIVLREAKADYEIKLIAPGKGSSAFYPKEVLQRDGPKVFKSGTHVYLNHPTRSEEAERPEGDVKNLAGVLTTDAAYHESHAKGPGLYARMKVFADHAQTVEEKAPHVGMSIRASGNGSGRMKDGLPVLGELTSAESVDVVTRAGAGGMILSESARSAQQEANQVEVDTKKLIETELRPLYERQRREDAREAAERMLDGVTLPDPAKVRIIERVIKGLDVSKDVEEKTLREAVIAEAKAEGEYLAQITGAGRVVGLGATSIAEGARELSKKERKALKESRKAEKREAVDIFEAIGLPKNAAKIAAKGRVA